MVDAAIHRAIILILPVGIIIREKDRVIPSH